MYSSYSFAPDRQPSRTSADATGDTAATRTAMGLGGGTSRAWAEPAATSQTERRDVAVAQADGEP
jgi:hypothetical protein